MRIASDTTKDIVTHYRRIVIEDGPVVDLGADEHSSYFGGTTMRVESLQMRWLDDAAPTSVTVRGTAAYADAPTYKDGSPRMYEEVFSLNQRCPEWLAELLMITDAVRQP